MSQYYRKRDIDQIVKEMEAVLEKTRTAFHNQYGLELDRETRSILWTYEQAIKHVKMVISRIDQKHHLSVVPK